MVISVKRSSYSRKWSTHFLIWFAVLDEEFTGAIAVNEFNGGLPALDQMEIEMMSDIRALFVKYRERLQEWEKAENNGNASTSDA